MRLAGKAIEKRFLEDFRRIKDIYNRESRKAGFENTKFRILNS